MQSQSVPLKSGFKSKYFIILILLTVLGITVYKMMQYEDSIRDKRIIRINVGGNSIKLIPDISLDSLQRKAKDSEIKFRAGKKYFSILESKIIDGENVSLWDQYFLKGVNLGVALPGKFPSEFSVTYEMYLDWFRKIAEMNANTIRVYTILPPEFYEAFAQYNIENRNKPLYILHGVWAVETDSNNYFEQDYSENFRKEIKDVIDVIHGNCMIKEKPGHASGVYARDVSSYVIGIILGREWEPVTVTTTNKLNKLLSKFNGNFVTLPSGSPMECWLAQMMDFTVHYETQIYEEQRPVSFVNWLPTDPMYHNSEFIESKKVREYDNDIVSIDLRKFYNTNLYKSGFFATYHAYPYYPDYIYLDNKYKNSLNSNGERDNYYGYLADLKNNCSDMPLVIGEYGLPSSRGNSHITPSGLDQGGHSEQDQANKNKLLTEDIFNTGCAGAIYFEWIDEWFKVNWLVLDFEIPAERRKLWHNMENPEQNFGIMAVEQSTKTIDGLINDWKSDELVSENNETSFSAGADATYFYMKYKIKDFSFSENNLHIAIDTYDKIKGNHKLPFLNDNIENGIEFLLNFKSTDSAEILADENYSVYSDIYKDYVPVYSSKESYSGKFIRQIMLSNRERESLLGEKTERTVYDRSELIYGNSSDSRFSNSNWIWNDNEKILEIRIPWHLLNVSDPSSRYVLDDKEGTSEIECTQTVGFNIYSYVSGKSDKNVVQIPDEKPEFITWEKWDKPVYTTRLKQSYYTLKNLFKEFDVKDSLNEKITEPSLEFSNWYENREAAISLSLDDGTMSQYLYGIPVLEKYGVKATFALVSDWTKDFPSSSSEKGAFSVEKIGWEQANELLQKGNEIASHNLRHVKMDTLSNAEALREMTESKILAESKLNSKIYTFVFPYSSTRKDLFDIPGKAGYIFARTGEESINKTGNIDLDRLMTYAVYNENVPNTSELFDYMNLSKGKWLILNYHNIFPSDSREMSLLKYHDVYATYSVTPEMFDKHVRLIRNSGYWIAPISVIGRYYMERNESKLEFNFHNSKIFLSAKSKLDQSIFNIPLTVVFTTDWEVVKITNSADDGIYNPRNNTILINIYPNQEVLIENLSN